MRFDNRLHLAMYYYCVAVKEFTFNRCPPQWLDR